MKKIYLLIIIAVTGLFVSGCSASQGGYTTTTSTSTSSTSVTTNSLGTSTTTSIASTTTTIPSSVSVDISNSAFNPSSVTVAVLGTVVWTNNDSLAHTATSTSGPLSFDSGIMSFGGTYSHQFTVAGTYQYRCSIHTNMTGTIIVQ